jgi:iron complex transport system substrate-binding protein
LGFELGISYQVFGPIHECDYHPSIRRLPKVTRKSIPHDASSGEIDGLVRQRLKTPRALFRLDFPTSEQLRPDLIVTQALCVVCAVAESEVTAPCGLRHPKL